jgi:hypothetical protein
MFRHAMTDNSKGREVLRGVWMNQEAMPGPKLGARGTYWVNFHVGEFVSDSTIFLALCWMRTPLLYQRRSLGIVGRRRSGPRRRTLRLDMLIENVVADARRKEW